MYGAAVPFFVSAALAAVATLMIVFSRTAASDEKG
jgi:hypothetical protein